MVTADFIFRFRWIFLGFGGLLLLFLLIRRLPLGIARSAAKFEGRFLERANEIAQLRFSLILTIVLSMFFTISTVGKFTQLHALALSGQDFWLFEDMLRQMGRGAPFLTRFAPQGLGWVQHGAVHGFFTWYLALPLVWLFGPTIAALLYGPLLLTAAGGILAVLCRFRLGPLGALLITTAFLVSNQVGKVLTYEVHPEVAYPFFVFLWAWAAGLGDQKFRPWTLFFAVTLGMGIKEDAFLVFFPLMAAVAWLHRTEGNRDLLKAAGFSLISGIVAGALHLFAVKQWASGNWGPLEWDGARVLIPEGPGLFHGLHWDSIESALEITRRILESVGGAGGAVLRVFRFLVSRPWLSILIMAPWVIIRPAFWIALSPLAAALAVIGGTPSVLGNYYSAPVIGSFWVMALMAIPLSSARRIRYSIWLLLAALLVGSGGPEFHFAGPNTRALRAEATALAGCIATGRGQGVVSSRFLEFVPQNQVWSDRIPASGPNYEQVMYFMISADRPSYEIPRRLADVLIERLSTDPNWQQVGLDCQAARRSDTSGVVLFRRL